jgi:hypothetical protein
MGADKEIRQCRMLGSPKFTVTNEALSGKECSFPRKSTPLEKITLKCFFQFFDTLETD